VGTHRLSSSLTESDDALEAASRLETIVIGLWLAAVALILLVGQWPRIVHSNWQLAGWPLVDELAILQPVIAPLILVWAAMYRLERANAGQPLCLSRYLWLQARHHLGLVLLPPLAVVGFVEGVNWLNLGPAK